MIDPTFVDLIRGTMPDGGGPLHVVCHPDDEARMRAVIAGRPVLDPTLHLSVSYTAQPGQAYLFGLPIALLGCPECAPSAAPGPPLTVDGG